MENFFKYFFMADSNLILKIAKEIFCVTCRYLKKFKAQIATINKINFNQLKKSRSEFCKKYFTNFCIRKILFLNLFFREK